MSLHKQAIWSALPLVIVTALNLVSVPWFFRYLGADGYALLLYVVTLSGAFGFMDLGLGVAVGRYIGMALGRGDRAAVESYWATGNAIALPLLSIVGAGFGILGIFFGTAWFNVQPGQEYTLRWCFLIGGVNLVVGFYAQFWAILSQAFLDFKFLGILRVVFSLLQIVPSLLLARWTGDPLVLIIWGTVVGLGQLGALMMHGSRTYDLWPFKTPFSKARAIEMSGYTFKVFLNLVCGSVFGTVDRLIIGRLAPAIDFASYNVAANAGARLQTASQAMMGPVFHNSNRVAPGDQSKEVLKTIYTRAFDPVLGMSVLAIAMATLWGDPILRLWLGASLAESVRPVFAPVILAFSLQAVSSISTAQFASLNRQGLVLVFQVASAVVAVGAVWIGWHRGGLTGASYGLVVSRLVGVAQDLTLSTMIRGGGWASFSAWRITFWVAAVSLLCFVAAMIPVDPPAFWPVLLLFLNAVAGVLVVVACVRSEKQFQAAGVTI